jgi:ABC-2 type transport system permease protein
VVARAPAVTVVVACAVALLGLGPRWPPAAWVLVAYAVVVGLFGQILRLPDWAVDLSVFEHMPRLGAGAWVNAASAWETAAAAALTVAGWMVLRGRDLG